MATKAAVQSGLLLMLDLVKFSSESADDQVKLVRKLWDVLAKSPLVKEKAKYGTIPNSTGDGYLLAFAGKVDESQLIQLAIGAITAMAREDKSCPAAGLKVGLHRGPFTYNEDKASGHVVAIGTGPNLCDRVLGFADSGYIVASDAFVTHWETERGEKSTREVTPQFSRRILVYAKHNFPLRIRIYRGPGAKHNDRLPSKIEKLFETELEIIRTLGEVEELFVGLLREKCTDRVPATDVLSARVSLFGFRLTLPMVGPAKKNGSEEGVLEPTIYRFHRSWIRPAKGFTYYPVRDPASGPQATAFVSGEPKAVTALPDPASDHTIYSKRLNECGFGSDTVGTFSRHARSFLCFQFGRKDLGRLGIACIDCHDALERITAGELEEIGAPIQKQYSPLLAGLWNERVK